MLPPLAGWTRSRGSKANLITDSSLFLVNEDRKAEGEIGPLRPSPAHPIQSLRDGRDSRWRGGIRKAKRGSCRVAGDGFEAFRIWDCGFLSPLQGLVLLFDIPLPRADFFPSLGAVLETRTPRS
jgi:hypothetical protein